MGSTIDGLVSGLNTTQIITQLMQVERLPEQQMLTHQSDAQNLLGILQTLNMKVSSLNTTASALVPDPITGTSVWKSALATSSDPTRVTASAGTGAIPGGISFTVTSLATAGAAVSTGTVGDTTTTKVATGNLMVAKGAAAVGIGSFDFDPATGGPTTTTHTVVVTKASSAASLTGNALVAPITINAGSNDQFSYAINGQAVKTVTLSPGTYTPGQLATEVQRATGGDMRVVVNGNGALTLTNASEGSAATLTIGSSTATNASLGLADGVVGTGQGDAAITVDGTARTLNLIVPGAKQVLTGKKADGTTDETFQVTYAGGLRVGTATASPVTVAPNATLNDVVTAINKSGAGVSAAAVQVSSAAYRLQLTSSTTGSASDVTLGSNSFLGGTLGGTQQLTAGADTVLHVGTGPGAYDVTSSTTAVSGLLPGVTITALKADPTSTISVGVTKDSAGMAAKVKAMVDQANSVLGFISDNSSYNATTKVSGALMGSSMADTVARQITDAVIGTSSVTPAMAGVSVQKDGTIAFDQAAFLAAYATDPAKVESTMTTLGQQIADASKQLSDPISGSLTAQINGQQDEIKDVTQQIADFEDRMTLRQQSLQQIYTNLETALGQLQSQSQWLTGQLAGLPSYSSMTSK